MNISAERKEGGNNIPGFVVGYIGRQHKALRGYVTKGKAALKF
jgi:hypothetical protein